MAFDLESVVLNAALPLQELVHSLERQLIAIPVEVAFVLDAEGQLLVRRVGEADRIGFTPEEEARMQHGYFTHNHPSGAFFSVRDILFAHDNDLQEMRVVAGRQVHRLVRPAQGWDVRLCYELAQVERQRAERAVRKDLNQVKYERRLSGAATWLLKALHLPTQTEAL